jgi:hypothetical protein
MKIQKQDIYHGPALMQIVEHRSFKALNRASGLYGHYLINTDREVFTKFRSVPFSPWQFTFAPAELAAIRRAASGDARVFVCLVCGHETICALTVDEFSQLVDPASKAQQWIRVSVPRGGGCHVSGSIGQLKRVIPHGAFPEKLFLGRYSRSTREVQAESGEVGSIGKDAGPAQRCQLTFKKATKNMMRWDGDVNGRRLVVCVPKWRVPQNVPDRIQVLVGPGRSSRAVGSWKGSRTAPISVLVSLTKSYRMRFKYSQLQVATPERGHVV